MFGWLKKQPTSWWVPPMIDEVGKLAKYIEVRKLDAKPGDVLVLQTHRPVPRSIQIKLRELLEPVVPQGVKVMVLDHDVSLRLLTAREIAERTDLATVG